MDATDTATFAPATTTRQERGLALAKTRAKAFRQIAGETYLVPSASASGSGYVVDVPAGSCSCPDFETVGGTCKHQWALRYFRHEIEMPDGTTVVTEGAVLRRITYKQDWPAYNAAQCEEQERVQTLLGGLCDGIVQPKHVRGRRPVPLRDAIFCATMKVYGTMSGRRSTTDIRACEADGLVGHAPSYNSLFRTVERPDLMPLLKTLVEESATPLRAIETSFAADGTGFATNTYARWYDEKYGEEKKCQRWVKLHAMIGTVTNVVTAAEVTEGHVNDCPMFVPLLNATAAKGFDVREVSADKAYLSNENLTAIEAIGAAPYIPFKINSTPTGASEAWRRLYHVFSLNRDDFLRHYHKRSNVEATFSSIKRKFGGSVRSKLPAAQMNEVLLKCLCHNLSMVTHAIHELGIEPKFWMPAVAGA